jgi:hypothetical protein
MISRCAKYVPSRELLGLPYFKDYSHGYYFDNASGGAWKVNQSRIPDHIFSKERKSIKQLETRMIQFSSFSIAKRFHTRPSLENPINYNNQEKTQPPEHQFRAACRGQRQQQSW